MAIGARREGTLWGTGNWGFKGGFQVWGRFSGMFRWVVVQDRGATFTVRLVAIQAGLDRGALNRGMSFGKDDAAMK